MVDAPRADARRNIEAILGAAREALAADPGTSLNAIAERAGVHRATLHRHFPNRERLLERLMSAFLDAIDEAVFEVDPEAEDLLAEIEALTRRTYTVNIEWKAHAWAPLFNPEMRERRGAMIAVVSDLFDAAWRAGLLRQDLDVRELLVAWGSGMPFLSLRVSLAEWTLDEATDYTMRLLRPPSS